MTITAQLPQMAAPLANGNEPHPGRDEAIAETLMIQVTLAQSTKLARAGRYEAALTLLTTLPPTLPAVLDLQARIFAQQGRLAEASHSWRQAQANDSDNTDYQAGLNHITQLQQGTYGLLSRRAILASLLILFVCWLSITAMRRPVRELEAALAGMEQQMASLQQQTEVAPTPNDPSPTPLPRLPLAMVQRELKMAPTLTSFDLQVQQEGQVLYLSGVLPDFALKVQVEELVKSIPGIGAVDSTRLLVSLPPLAQAVRAALNQHEVTARLDVTIQQIGQTIWLAGVVPTLADKETLTTVATSVEGVVAVETQGVVIVPPASLSRQYVVQPGDSLGSIATLFYGDPDQWPLLYRANRQQLPGPNLIYPGTLLEIPPLPLTITPAK